jgi:hypothetical protein
MIFSVTVWNMQRRVSGWAYLDQALEADVSLRQEVAAAPTDRSGVAKTIGGNRRGDQRCSVAIGSPN